MSFSADLKARQSFEFLAYDILIIRKGSHVEIVRIVATASTRTARTSSPLSLGALMIFSSSIPVDTPLGPVAAFWLRLRLRMRPSLPYPLISQETPCLLPRLILHRQTLFAGNKLSKCPECICKAHQLSDNRVDHVDDRRQYIDKPLANRSL